MRKLGMQERINKMSLKPEYCIPVFGLAFVIRDWRETKYDLLEEVFEMINKREGHNVYNYVLSGQFSKDRENK